uniref:hypothetical protein n=1 Tax=Sporosarcina cyprini TaxID=2910523 RepID=UPI001EDD0C94|nr:hypothetical protein [Sporosarcina cyprini]MCG3088381.1 hypothetical protein [Sporosarcina cyprini]
MITTQTFLETFVCKTGESVYPLGNQEWDIQKWSARTYRTLGNVLAPVDYDSMPPEEVAKLGLKPKSRRSALPISDSLLSEALRKGWLVQEVRFKADGKTPSSIHYRMGPGLYEFELRKKEEAAAADQELRQTLLQEIQVSSGELPSLFLARMNEFASAAVDEEAWSNERVRKFIHFLIAFLRLKQWQQHMEYKEIGATYYRRIGGSKVFDANRDVFIQRLEKWLGAPVHELGIVSTGSVGPMLFTGDLQGKFSAYHIGAVHATTDLAVALDQYSTSANILWLVENRAVLTRMATEVEFLKDTSSFVLGVDGQVRGAHRKLIRQICQNSNIQLVIIWVDADFAGTVIARDLADLAGGVAVRFVGTADQLFTDLDAYQKWSEGKSTEQEMTLGGPAEWKKICKR